MNVLIKYLEYLDNRHTQVSIIKKGRCTNHIHRPRLKRFEILEQLNALIENRLV